MKFDPGFEIEIIENPMGFKYGENTFGPRIENRKLNDIRASLMEPDCDGPEIVYAIAMDLGKTQHYSVLKEQHLLYGAVTYAKGKLGKEPIRSQGHIHKKSDYGDGWSTPEVYQIWEGKAVIYMQEYADEDPGKCYAVYAEPGDIVIVPPSWAHATINADPKNSLTFGAWCDLDYAFEYQKVREHNGLSWYPLVGDDKKLKWFANKKYKKSKLIEKSPNSYSDFGINQKESIYVQYEKNPETFLFVPKPLIKEKAWLDFIP